MKVINTQILKMMLVGVVILAVAPISISVTLSNQAEQEDDIVCTVFYPWYANPNTSGYWRHWEEVGYLPPKTWSANYLPNYLPNYPDSTWNPSVQLYDSTDTEVLRWQDSTVRRAGIDIAISSWWGIGTYEDNAFAKAIGICKSVQWCIYYEKEGYGNPSPSEIYSDLKYVIDNYGPTHNYAKIDDKWIIFVYVAIGTDVADRWRQAKEMLASDGYDVYLNGDRAIKSDPWDSRHIYNPIEYAAYTSSLSDVDDSALISPGFWLCGEDSPRLNRSLYQFTSSWDLLVVETSTAFHK